MKRKKILSLVLALAILFTLTMPGGMPVYGASELDEYTFDISQGNITISPDGDKLKVTRDGTLLKGSITTDQQITIIGPMQTTLYKVLVDRATANIQLAGVDIQLGSRLGGCAFELANGANVTLTLKENTTNILNSGGSKAGLRVASGQKLTIKGEGSLNAIGGKNGAGIGGSNYDAGGDITISGGTVIATGSTGAAGIGGGTGGAGGKISISGGTVTATGGTGAAGIGGSYSEAGGKISISGGMVTAAGGDIGAGIGGGRDGAGGEINISGGMVTAIGGDARPMYGDEGGAGIGGGFEGKGGNITINSPVEIRALSNGHKPAIEYTNLSSESTAKLLIADFPLEQASGSAMKIYQKENYWGSESLGFEVNAPFKSIAFLVPSSGDYMLKVGQSWQQHSGGIAFNIGETGCTVLNSLSSISDTEILQREKNALTEDMIRGENASLSQITTSLEVLPEIGIGGSVITWESEYPLVVSNNGQTVVRPKYETPDKTVDLTATLTRQTKTGEIAEKKEFKLTVLAETTNPAIADVEADKAALTEALIKGANTSLSSVTTTLAALPTSGAKGSTITWKSSNPSVVLDDGQTVVRPVYGEGNALVTLTATLTKGKVEDNKEFKMKVLAETINPAIADVETDKAVLTKDLIKGTNTSLDSVTTTLAALPTSGAKGSTITWKSSNPSVVSDNGQTVTRPAYGAGDAAVTLTATLSKGAVKADVVFHLIVRAKEVPSNGGGSSSGGGGGSSPAKSAVQPIDPQVFKTVLNGTVLGGETVSETTEEGRKVTTLTLDESRLVFDNSSTQLKLISSSDSEVQRVQLSGQLMQRMQQKKAQLCFETPEARYSLRGDQINWEEALSQLGEHVALKDIKITVEIAKADAETVKQAEAAAKRKGFTILGPVMEFRIFCQYGQKQIELNKFNSYVERDVLIPAGSSSTGITGVVLDPNSSVRPMPTQTVQLNGRTYARINSRTNSTYFAASYTAAFTDTASHWAKEDIQDMASRMIAGGSRNGIFEPDRAITRGEFAAMLVKALGLKPEAAASSFRDVKDTDWNCSAIETAVKYNLVSGIGNGKFGPKDTITREQAISMTARAMQVTGLKMEAKEEEIESLLSAFGDAQKASAYAKPGIAACIKAGLINSKEGQMHQLKGNITRAETVVMIRRLLAKSNLI